MESSQELKEGIVTMNQLPTTAPSSSFSSLQQTDPVPLNEMPTTTPQRLVSPHELQNRE
jgi:hypothetical protein